MDNLVWTKPLEDALTKMLTSSDFSKVISEEHTKNTPFRFIAALGDMFEGVWCDPIRSLGTTFPADGCDQMIHVKEMSFFSMCAHHLLPFFGKASFAYIPDEKIVGLSKIPRLLEVYARRPQVQEQLSKEVVQTFQEVVKPKGCGILIRSYHMCCMARGIKQPTSYMETTHLEGVFKDASVKAEFVASAFAANWKVF